MGFLAPLGTFVARYLKGIGIFFFPVYFFLSNEISSLLKGHAWYILHLAIQYTTLALIVAGFIIIETDLGSLRSAHFNSAHQVIGIIVIALVFVQVILYSF